MAKVGEEARTEVDVVGGDALADEMDEFCKCIRGEATPETGGPEGLEVVAVLEAVVRSAPRARWWMSLPFAGSLRVLFWRKRWFR